jgi:hypothetical protein
MGPEEETPEKNATLLAALLPAGAQECFRVASCECSLDGLVAGREQPVTLCACLLKTVIGAVVAVATCLV